MVEGEILSGLVVRVDSGASVVEAGGERYRCKLRGRLKNEETLLMNLVTVGDEVRFTLLPDGEGAIEEVLERRSVLARSTMKKHEGLQTIAANVDLLVIVASVKEPRFKPRFVDRVLIAAELGEMRPVLCVTKIDLAKSTKYEKKVEPYKKLGMPVVFTSVVTGEGLGELRDILKGSVSALAGQSGVGKTSLLNALIPGSGFATGGVNPVTGKGKHTTAFAALVPFPFGGYVVDTPGLKGFSVGLIEKEELAYYFPEMEPYLAQCRFGDCTHRHEPGCGVKAAVEAGAIPRERYESYIRIYDSLAQSER
jgi:ribosome biogenesis GTPase